ncbi:hypothetical protein DV517_63190 [Streptomyces sp. S816]|uniref:phosphopantetheine-binding protein n=1 Tax=Streptomyces sp. S816 TaxID=2283197 RepID=UPI00109D1F3D|nr:phosphopantetheine-binding protein [Streptomyces sp. S816]TGZ14836.1 hypothetical protein DV517_63190 [Streptomyces sp. S816]
MPRTARNQAAVIAHGTGPETRLVGFVVLDEDGTDLSLLSVSTHLTDRLPAHMVPAALIPLDDFPLTPNGKPDHAVLAARAAQTLPATSGTTPDQDTDDLVAVIADIWSEVLGAGPLGPTDDFFALGGDSFRAIRAVREREARTGLQVPMHLVFEASEFAEFAVAIAEDTETAGTSGGRRAGPTSGAHGRRRGGRGRRHPRSRRPCRKIVLRTDTHCQRTFSASHSIVDSPCQRTLPPEGPATPAIAMLTLRLYRWSASWPSCGSPG